MFSISLERSSNFLEGWKQWVPKGKSPLPFKGLLLVGFWLRFTVDNILHDGLVFASPVDDAPGKGVDFVWLPSTMGIDCSDQATRFEMDMFGSGFGG